MAKTTEMTVRVTDIEQVREWAERIARDVFALHTDNERMLALLKAVKDDLRENGYPLRLDLLEELDSIIAKARSARLMSFAQPILDMYAPGAAWRTEKVDEPCPRCGGIGRMVHKTTGEERCNECGCRTNASLK